MKLKDVDEKVVRVVGDLVMEGPLPGQVRCGITINGEPIDWVIAQACDIDVEEFRVPSVGIQPRPVGRCVLEIERP